MRGQLAPALVGGSAVFFGILGALVAGGTVVVLVAGEGVTGRLAFVVPAALAVLCGTNAVRLWQMARHLGGEAG